MAWMPDMIGRPYPRSMATPWVFMAMSSAPSDMPSRNRDAASEPRLHASEGRTIAAHAASSAQRVTAALVQRRTAADTSCVARISPTGEPSSATLSWAVSRPSSCLMSGMRDTQVASTPP